MGKQIETVSRTRSGLKSSNRQKKVNDELNKFKGEQHH